MIFFLFIKFSSFPPPYSKINAAAEVIYEAVDPNANIIFGALVDESMNGEIAITVIATGFPVMTTMEASKGIYFDKVSSHFISYLILSIEYVLLSFR